MGESVIPIGSTPWLQPAAIAALEEILEPHFEALETGAGGSTIWLASRVKHVVTLEHDPVWHSAVARELQLHGLTNVDLKLSPFYPSEGIPSGLGPFDLVLIDGRGRVQSCRTARVKPGGYLILDNSEREHYAPALQLLDARGWERTDYIGQWTTTIWRASANR